MVLQSAIRSRHHPPKETALSAQAQPHFTRDDSGYWTTYHENRFGAVITDESHRAKKKEIDPPLAHFVSYSKCHHRLTLLSLNFLFNSLSPYIALIQTFL